jgi:uracil-DNA glycosylase family 4
MVIRSRSLLFDEGQLAYGTSLWIRYHPLVSELDTLTASVQACTACERVLHSHVLGVTNGNPAASVMFVGEAPGRLGAGRTGVPFFGDESGRRFEEILLAAGLTRAEVFVTNAILCNPLDGLSRNRRPLISEVRRCLPFLRGQVLAVEPEVVVALGDVALLALGLIEPHSATLRGHCGSSMPWFGRILVPLYHPGRRSTVHRLDADQRADWQRLGEMLAERQLAGTMSKERPRPLSGAAGVKQAMK